MGLPLHPPSSGFWFLLCPECGGEVCPPTAVYVFKGAAMAGGSTITAFRGGGEGGEELTFPVLGYRVNNSPNSDLIPQEFPDRF